MVAGLGWHQPDSVRWHVGDVGKEDINSSRQPAGQGVEKVALIDAPAQGLKVLPGTLDGFRFDIDGVKLNTAHPGGKNQTEGSAAAAQVQDHRPRESHSSGLVYQELRSLAGNEDIRSNPDPHPAKVHPSENVFQRNTCLPSCEHDFQPILFTSVR